MLSHYLSSYSGITLDYKTCKLDFIMFNLIEITKFNQGKFLMSGDTKILNLMGINQGPQPGRQLWAGGPDPLIAEFKDGEAGTGAAEGKHRPGPRWGVAGQRLFYMSQF